MTKRITQTHRDALRSVYEGRPVEIVTPRLHALVERGLVEVVGGEIHLTALGREIKEANRG